MINIKVFEDIGFTVIGSPGEYKAKFTVYEYWGTCDGTTVFAKDCLPVYDISEAEIYLHGEVKWDGCSNWHFDEQDSCRLHGCSREDLLALGEVMARCWDWAAELCEKWELQSVRR